MIEYQITPKPVLFSGMLRDFPNEIKREGFDGIERIAQASLKRIRRLTPGKDLPKGWGLQRKGGKNYRIRELFNGDDRAYEPISLKSGRTTNLLEMMEYGTRPHEIVPVRADKLVFEIDGRIIRTKHVDHPGTKAYGFTGITYAEAMRMLAQLQTKLANSLKAFGTKR